MIDAEGSTEDFPSSRSTYILVHAHIYKSRAHIYVPTLMHIQIKRIMFPSILTLFHDNFVIQLFFVFSMLFGT
jgi:hypothetical protein